MRILIILFLSLLQFSVYAMKFEKLVVVISKDWTSSQGTLYLLDFKEGKWKFASNPFPVVLGKNGLAWGRGLHGKNQFLCVKKEGDGKAPSGIFQIRQILYGYASKPPTGVKIPYHQITSAWVAVDDPKSLHYNRIVNRHKIKKDWNSFEEMRRNDNLYKWLLVIEHNTKNTLPYAGSCIFMHLWRGQNSHTAGCTAMSEENLLHLARWMSLDAKTVLLQIPFSQYEYYRKSMSLPKIGK